MLPSRKTPTNNPEEINLDCKQSLQTLQINQGSKTSNALKVLNTIYGLLCGLLTVVLTTTEPFKACGECGGSMKVAVLFFLVYMYYVSIAWLVGMAISIIIAKRTNKISIKNHHGFNRRLSYFIRSKENLFSVKKPLESKPFIDRYAYSNSQSSIKNHLAIPEESSYNLQICSPRSFNNLAAVQSQETVNLDLTLYQYTYDYNNGTGELYIRVGR